MDEKNNPSCTSTPATSAITIDDLKRAVQVVQSLPVEPFKQWMEDQGMSPNKGYELYLPIALHQHVINVPNYVKFSPIVHAPTILPSLTNLTLNHLTL